MSLLWLITPNNLSLIVTAVAIAFAVCMHFLSRETFAKPAFVTSLLEGFSLASSLVVLASLFNRELFEKIGDNKTFLMIVALMTLSYGIRDVFGRFDRPNKRDPNLHSMREREH